jgi:3-oxoacyl-[acyl-carrier protein] reductase
MMFDLTGMTALITGASGGIGSAIARACARQGARLALSGSNSDRLESFRAELGGDHVALVANLSDGASVDRLVPQAVEALGKLDILVNNAGVTRDNLHADEGRGMVGGDPGQPRGRVPPGPRRVPSR